MNSNSSRFLRMINDRNIVYSKMHRNAVPPPKAASSFKYSPSRPETWGPVFWDTMHVIAAAYPLEPTEDDKKKYRDYYNSIQYVLPCETCKEHFKEIMNKFPVGDHNLASRRALSEYVLHLRNEVNEAIGRPRIFTYKKLSMLINQESSNNDDLVELAQPERQKVGSEDERGVSVVNQQRRATNVPVGAPLLSASKYISPFSRRLSSHYRQSTNIAPVVKKAEGLGHLTLIKNLQLQSTARQNVARQIRIANQIASSRKSATLAASSAASTSSASAVSTSSTLKSKVVPRGEAPPIAMVAFNGSGERGNGGGGGVDIPSSVARSFSASSSKNTKTTAASMPKKKGCGCNKRKTTTT